MNSTNVCDVLDGSCTCKPHVEGHLCDKCSDGYHSLTGENPDGRRAKFQNFGNV